MFSIVKDTKITECVAPTVAGTTDVTGDTIDMQNFGSVAFLVSFGTITTGGVTSIKVQQDSDSAMGTAADLLGSSVSITDAQDDHSVLVEVAEPRERYVRVIVDRGTANAVINTGYAIQTNPKISPTTHDSSTIVTPELHVSPAEGTA